MKNAKNRLKNICKKGENRAEKITYICLTEKALKYQLFGGIFAMENPTKRAVILS